VIPDIKKKKKDSKSTCDNNLIAENAKEIICEPICNDESFQRFECDFQYGLNPDKD
jgi:hypothetical protein